MPEIVEDRSYKIFGGIVLAALILAAVLAGLKFTARPDEKPVLPPTETPARGAVVLPPVLDYNRMEKDEKLQSLMNKRKETYGVGEEIDLVLQSDETLKVGDLTVSMQEIEEKIRLKIGDVIEDDLVEGQIGDAGGPPAKEGGGDPPADREGAVPPAVEGETHPHAVSETDQNSPKMVRVYGIHIVLPGDNIWNIHFNFVKSYFAHRNIAVEPLADESDNRGFSSGIGRILKFSENMVYIFNLRERKLDVDLNLIHPMTKIVVFNMRQVFALLDQVDYTYVSRIEFDGETIWIPSAQ